MINYTIHHFGAISNQVFSVSMGLLKNGKEKACILNCSKHWLHAEYNSI